MALPLVTDPKTGYLTSLSPNRRTFDAQKKLRVLELVKQYAAEGKWPRLAVICDTVDCGVQTLKDHLKWDAQFRADYEDAMQPVQDHLVSNLVRQGEHTPVANIFLLKSRWPEEFGENRQTVHVDIGGLKGIFEKNQKILEGEIVQNPQIEAKVSTRDSDHDSPSEI